MYGNLKFFLLFGLALICTPAWAENDLTLETQSVLRQAYQEALLINNPFSQAWILRFIAEFQARANDLTGALASIQKIPELPKKSDSFSFTKNDAIWAVVRARAKLGDIKGARQAFGKFKDAHPHKHDHALGDIAAAQARKGDLQGSMDTIAVLREPKYRASVQVLIVEGLTLSGNLAEAEKMVAQISEDYFRAKGQSLVAGVYARRKKFSAALQLASTIQVPEHKDEALWGIALFQATAGDFEGAEHTATQIQPDTWMRLNALFDVAEIQAKAGNPTRAQKIVMKYGAAWEQAVGLQGLARILSKKGKKKEARRILELAFSRARREKGIYSEYSLIYCIIAQAELGDVKGALNNAAPLPNEELPHEHPVRQRALIGIASVQAVMSDSAGVSQTAKMIMNDVRLLHRETEDGLFLRAILLDARKQAWKEIAQGQAEAGDTIGALEWEKQLTEPEEKANVFLGIGEGLLKKMYPPTHPQKTYRFLFPM